ncbi:MAG: ABC transporter ATP-binding protein [Candidatus Micrarchaeota archaeon]|nr:ABC transporter ATP-binding protein [Candidatus Micrarchaeota archaeon]
MPTIEFKSVTKKFGKVVGLENASLRISDNEYAVLLGPSGCGKTTLLKSLAGIHALTSGRILVDGKDVTDLPPEERFMGFVFQDYALFPHMTVLQNAMYGPIVRGAPEEQTRKTAHEMLDLVRLSARYDEIPENLSGGMRQRVAVARALTTGSKILLLDEPLSALDAKVRKELRSEMRRMVKELGLTAIHVTHDQEEAMAIADKIVVMRKGGIEQVGSPHEVYANPQTLFVAGFIGEANFFEAYVRRIGKKAYLSTLGRTFLVPEMEEGPYIAVIRPEHIRIKPGSEAKVVSSRSFGAYVMNELDIRGQRVLVRSTEALSGHVGIEIDESKIMLFETPERGLDEALEVD